MRFDLHVHTNHSDGMLSPAEIVDLGVRMGLSGMAITDHDTITGIEEAVKQSNKYDNFIVIPGIEFSSIYNNEEVHILGYFIDYKSPSLIEMTNILKKSRIERGEKIIEKLNSLGYKISIEDVKSLSGDDYIGRPHIARALINQGYVYTIQEAFDRFLNRGCPGYVQRYNMTIDETIQLIKSNKGMAILAHPGLLKDKSIIHHCLLSGIDGIECIHSKHSETDVDYFTQIAKDNNLIITGGSDCHGDTSRGPLLLGQYFIDLNNISQFKELI